MCTVTWKFWDQKGYTVFFNRDELRSRSIATPPEINVIDNVKVLSPTDGDAGGSWIAVNEFAVLTCLLNQYEYDFQPDSGELRSRGLLVLDLSSSSSWDESKTYLREDELRAYKPFRLLQIFPTGEAKCVVWNGKNTEFFTFNECQYPQTGSSFKNKDVVAWRIAQFDAEEVLADVSMSSVDAYLERYHHSHDPDFGAYSVNMSREDAQTVSVSRIDVTQTEACFRYESKRSHGVDFDEPSFHRLSLGKG